LYNIQYTEQTVGEVELASYSWVGSKTNGIVSQGPGTVTIETTVCEATTATSTISSQESITLDGGIGFSIAGWEFNVGSAKTVIDSEGISDSFESCNSNSQSATQEVESGKTLYCSTFEGTTHELWEVEVITWSVTESWRQQWSYCYSCSRNYLHLCSKTKIGEPTLYSTQKAPYSTIIEVDLAIPTVSTHCKYGSYPSTPWDS
jgi:hypothetical protein